VPCCSSAAWSMDAFAQCDLLLLLLLLLLLHCSCSLLFEEER